MNTSIVFLHGSSQDIKIIACNETISNLIGSDKDIQFVLDLYSCPSYMSNYVSKADAGVS